MNKFRNNYAIIPFILASILFAACSANKNIQATTVPVPKSSKGIDSIEVERTFIDGCKYMAMEDYDNAVKSFEAVLKMDPRNSASMYQLANIYFKYNKFSDALEYAKNAVAISPKNTDYQILYADVLTYNSSFAKAAEVYEKVIALEPDHYDIYFRLSYNYEKANDLNKAISTLKRLEKLIGPDENLLVELQRLYNANHEPEKAIPVMEQLIVIDPQNSTYKRFLSEYYEQTGNHEMAQKIFDALLESDSNNTDLQFKKASLQEKVGDKRAYYNTMHKAFSNSAGNIDTKIFYLVLFVDSLGKPGFAMEDTVLKWTELLVSAHPGDAKSYAMRGDFLYYTDHLKEARETYRKSMNIRSDVFDVWIKMFYIDADLRDYDSLKVITENAMDYYPNQPLSYYFNGVALNNLHEYDAAQQALKRGLPMAGSNAKLKADIYGELGNAYHELKNDVESDKAFENSLQLNPDNPYTLNNYAYYLSLRNDKLDRAAEMSLHSISLVKDDASLEDTYAWILYKQKKYDDAKKWLEKALMHGGDKSGTINEHYGDVLYHLGDEDKALEYWQKAKSLGDASDMIDKKIADKKLYE